MGKLGLCLAACFAEKGIATLGIDIEENVINSINKGQSPIVEPGLADIVARLGGKTLRGSLNHLEAIEQTDITFVLVATPSNPDGSFSNRYVESALESLAKALRSSKKEYHLFVISSTVAPGSTEQYFIPLIEKHSGRKLNEGFGVCFDPDFVALGQVINDFLRPELIVIGESSVRAGDEVANIHHKVCENKPHIARMSITSAEIAKVSLNAYMTVKISFANSLANICENVEGADVDAITAAIGVDKRISPFYFKAGLSFGGTCFPRDTKAFVNLAGKYGLEGELVRAAEKINEFQDSHLAETVLKTVRTLQEKTIGVLGLSFKPQTPVITESPGIKLVAELLKHEVRVVAYDPLAVENSKVIFGDAIEFVSSAAECIERSSLVVIVNREREFKKAVEEHQPSTPKVILDCWRITNPSLLNKNFHHMAWGSSEKNLGRRSK